MEVQEQIDGLMASAERSGFEVSDELRELRTKLDALKESTYQNLTPMEQVQVARHPERPYTLDYIEALTDGFVEMRGDRTFRDDPAVVGGFATFQGECYGSRNRTVLVLGHQKGRDTKSRKYRRFGMPNPEGYRKALRLMKLAAKFNKPVITLLDTPGAYPGMEAEERGQAEAIARNLFEMARLPVPIVVVIIGEGASGGALGIGVGDRVLMLENAWYSVIAPESCSSILWRSWDYKEEAARALKLTAEDLIKVGVIDTIVNEPIGGAHRDPQTTFKAVGKTIATTLDELDTLSTPDLLDARLHKFDQMGVYEEVGIDGMAQPISNGEL